MNLSLGCWLDFLAPSLRVIGGIGTILVALLWMRLFPTLLRINSLAIVPEEALLVAEPGDSSIGGAPS